MATATQRKRKAAQRRHHARMGKAVAESARPLTYGTVLLGGSDAADVITVPSTLTDDLSKTRFFSPVPKRAKCPVCTFSQKVKRDGTMGRHDVYHGSDAHECAGTGKRWDSG